MGYYNNIDADKCEKIIVTLTSYHKRIDNIPSVLDTIFSQTLMPDLVVINLAFNEPIPERVQSYIDSHEIEVNRVPDTKVYKKLIPTLKKYPNDCIIAIDDDFLYPQGMIEDFVSIHRLYPFFPISGSTFVDFGVQCHCGCASLTKAEFFGEYLDYIDNEIINNCPSDDIVYTFFSNMNNHPYIRTKGTYFMNLTPFNSCDSYSDNYVREMGIYESFKYLENRFGKLPLSFLFYDEENGSLIINDIFAYYRNLGREEEHTTISYRIGDFFLKPFKIIRNMWRKHRGVE